MPLASWSSLTRPLAVRYASLRRDVAMVAATLTGKTPPPFSRRVKAAAASGAPAASAMLMPRSMRVAAVLRETADAVTLRLEDPTGAVVPFAAGQFFTVIVTVDGEELRRAYSACTSAVSPASVAITIKRVAGGKVSNHLNDVATSGMTLRVLGPSGAFVPTPSQAPRHLVLFAGGSGITPIMSIARTLLATEPNTRISLIYGNRAERDIIFRTALEDLAAAHEGRMEIRHVLVEPPDGWRGGVGLLDRERAGIELDALDAGDAELPREYFVCGPEAMMAEVRAVLASRGVDRASIHEERFASPHLRSAPQAASDRAHVVTLRVHGRERALTVQPGHTLLEAGLEAGEPMPYSCAMGGCGACKVRLCDGDVAMEEPNCLTDEERSSGYVLACVVRPRGDAVVEVEA